MFSDPAAPDPVPSVASPSRENETVLFLRRWLANPLKVGAIMPSAPALARRMARETLVRDGEVVVELGPGTGAVTRALLTSGVPEDRLVLVERDSFMHAYLARRFPNAILIHGDARRLERILPESCHGKVSTVVSSLPLVSLPNRVRDDIVKSAFAMLAPGGRFVQYTYGMFSPLPRKELGIAGRKVAFAGINLPPASIWRYTRLADAAAAGA
jgi:phosphatidylethanolamine/phosphatidyl-N-methylethanolamine N-methyltransferase